MGWMPMPWEIPGAPQPPWLKPTQKCQLGRYEGPVAKAVKSIYVASSWRNIMQEGVVHILRAAGFDVYDFKNPPNGNGFHWREVTLEVSPPGFGNNCRQDDYLTALEHPRAIEGFDSDFDAMKACDAMVLVLPCGRSAHLELGWAVGAGKQTAILLDDPCTPELMYKMIDHLSPNVADLLGWLGVED